MPKTQTGIAHKTEETALRAIIFAVADYWFALPVGAVQKISLCPPIKNSLEAGLGTIDLGDETATVVDLEAKFAPHQDHNFTRRYLLLTQTHSGEKCGLIATSPPSMVEIPLSTIRPLPPYYRESGNLGFISHLAVLPQEKEEETLDVFLLGMRELFSSPQQSPPTETPPTSSQQQFMRFRIGKNNALVPVAYVVKAIPLNPQAFFPSDDPSNGFIGDYNWQGETVKLLDLNPILGGSSPFSLESPEKTYPILMLRLGTTYVGILVKAVRQLEWYDLRDLQPDTDHPLLQGRFSDHSLLLNLKTIQQQLL